MPDGDDADLPASVLQLVDDAVGAHPERSPPSQTTSKRVSCHGLPLQQPECLGHGISDGPVEVEDLPSRSTSEDDSGHLPPAASSIEVPTQVGEGHRLAALDLGEAFFDSAERLRIREDFGCLFQGVVLVDGDEHGRRPPSPGHDDVLTEIGNAVDEVG